MALPDRSLMSCGLRSINDVVAVPARNSGCRSTFSRKPMSAGSGAILSTGMHGFDKTKAHHI